MNETVLLVYEGTVGGNMGTILLDSGANANFISTQFVAKHNLPVVDTQSIRTVKLANGQRLRCNKVVQHVSVQMQTYTEPLTFVVTDLDHYDVLLGKPWLTKKNPEIDWQRNTTTFQWQGTTIQLTIKEEMQPGARLEISAIQLKRLMKTNPEGVICVIREEDEDKEEPKKTPKEQIRELDIPPEMKNILQLHVDVFEDLPDGLPPQRPVDHEIPLEPGTQPIYQRTYKMGELELRELRAQLEMYLKKGWIKPSTSPYGAPILFVKKKDGGLRMCVDYRGLNAVTIKNRYPLPHIEELLDRLHGAKWFTKIDLQSGYYQVRMALHDIDKTAFRCRYGHYHWLVMPFGLTNAPPTFMAMMHNYFSKYLDNFIIIFLDDILIFSKSLTDHVKHVSLILHILREQKLYAKVSKCDFCRRQVDFLGFTVTANGLQASPKKTEAIQQWPVPTTVRDVRSFLGFCNYYRKFVHHYSGIVAPLTALTRDQQPWQWSLVEQQAFDTIKQRLCSAPTLLIPDPQKPFVLTTDASNVATAAVLTQDHGRGQQPVAFTSTKLTEAQRNYTVMERELLAVFQAVTMWRSYLEGQYFVIRTDNRNLLTTSTNQVQRKPMLIRWLQFLGNFNFRIEHVKGSENKVDALTRRTDYLLHAMTFPITEVEFFEAIKLAYRLHPVDSTKYQYEEATQLWRTDNGRIVIPESPELRHFLLHEAHASNYGGHYGVKKTVAKLTAQVYWPNMYQDVEIYIKTCGPCQRLKTGSEGRQGKLQPLPIPSRPWLDISMDFVTHLPLSRGPEQYDSILVVVDRLTKMAHFIPTWMKGTAVTVALQFFNHVVKHHGLPSSIVSDRDPKFTSTFWNAVTSSMGTKLLLSTAFHPQTDGQTERTIRTLKMLLRLQIQEAPTYWADLLPYCEFAYNSAIQSSTKFSPFQLNYGYVPTTPLTALAPAAGKRCKTLASTPSP